MQPSSTANQSLAQQLRCLQNQLEKIYPQSVTLSGDVSDALVSSGNRLRQKPKVGPSAALGEVTSAANNVSSTQRLAQEKNRKRVRSLAVLMGFGLAVSIGVGGLVFAAHQRYGDRSLANIPLQTEAIEGQRWTGENITFTQRQGNQFDVSFMLSDGDNAARLALRDIDLTLFMPEVPAIARNHPQLEKWFLTEREFNRQRVIFEAGSEHIQLPENVSGELANYSPEDISVALTNNCLGAGYWELAISVEGPEGGSEKIYQGYFTFPRGAYAQIISLLNPISYWQQVRSLEAWPGFSFLSGMPFALNQLRQVNVETATPVSDLKGEAIIAQKEQLKKQDLVVYADGGLEDIETWEDLRGADLQFQSFVAPGVYDENKLWPSDFGQLETVTRGVVREIVSPLSAEPLTEVEIVFKGDRNEHRKLVISGIDVENVPQLSVENYSDGLYMPLGFGTPFTQDYEALVENPPAQSPFFSVVLDQNNRVVDYRRGIGINGLVMHRDADDAGLLHIYVMSYERITLVGHYTMRIDS